MPDFCSGATNRLGCFIEGFSLRRVQIALSDRGAEAGDGAMVAEECV